MDLLKVIVFFKQIFSRYAGRKNIEEYLTKVNLFFIIIDIEIVSIL